MGKYLRKFENHASYEEARQNLILPNVSLCKQENEVHYNPYVPPKLIVYYDIQDISSPTTICTNYDSSIKSIEVDGVLLDSVVTTYQFNSVGEHIIKYEFKNPTTVGRIFTYQGLIKRAVIADTFTSIEDFAFEGCYDLTNVTIGNGITSIGYNAFIECVSLTNVTIGSNVTSIAHGAFASCTSLTSITISDSVTSIDDGAFYNCSSLTSITSLAMTAPTIQYDTFQGVKTGGTLTVPSGSSGYDVWMQNADYYLGSYNWAKVEQ